MRFETKIDWMGMSLILGAPIILSFVFLLKLSDIIDADIFLPKEHLFVATPIFWIWAALVWKGTYYTIENDKLTARFAFIWRTVQIQEIIELKKIVFGRSTYGLSKDVLSIRYGKSRFLDISPTDRDEMIRIIEKIKERSIANKTNEH